MQTALRHWARKYPTFIVNGKKQHTGWNKDALEGVLQRTLKCSLKRERGKST
jgi:hypothetical protein